MHRLYYKVKIHCIITKWVVENPFLKFKSNVFFNKNIEMMLKFKFFAMSKFISP
jgi:hypothetical protein